MRPCRGHWRVILGSCGVIGVMCGSFEGHKEGLGLFAVVRGSYQVVRGCSRLFAVFSHTLSNVFRKFYDFF